MHGSLMVPLDGSRFAEQALPVAVAIARRAGIGLDLVRVCPNVTHGEGGEEEELDYVRHVAASLESQLPGRISVHVPVDELGPLEYPPPQPTRVAYVLTRYAADTHAAVIVMATHGRGGVRRAWLGSVADSLIRIASRPVLLVRPDDERFGTAAAADRGFNHILIPLDGSETAEQAIPSALELGSLFGARYTLLRVVSPLTWQVSPHAGDPFPVPASPLSREAVAASLEAVAARLRQPGVEVAAHLVAAPSAGPAIIDFAAEHGVDAIVIGTHGAARVRRMLLGSVTDKVVRGSSMPVLVCNTRRVRREAVLAGAGAEAAPLQG
jgi:nucleotide-binding universal stress UspA family protein